jgi:hypothetical protein
MKSRILFLLPDAESSAMKFPFLEFLLPRLGGHGSFGSWPCKNSSALRGRRSISEELRIMKLNHPAQIRRDTVLENCIFYISLMYEFLHSQGHDRQNLK